MESFSYQGIWWLPNDKDEQLTGNLSYSPDTGLQLRLIGTFNNPKRSNQRTLVPGNRKFPIVYGIVENGQAITLLDCAEANHIWLLATIITLNLQCKYAYMNDRGRHLASEGVKFSEVKVEYTYLFDWAGQSGMEITNEFRESRFHELTLKYQFPQPLVATCNDVQLSIEYRYENAYPRRRNVFVEQATCIFLSEKPLDFEQWMNNYISQFQDFLTFATERPNSILKISTNIQDEYIKPDEHLPYDTETGKSTQQFKIVYWPVFYSSESEREVVSYPTILFSFDTFNEYGLNFSEVMGKWFTFNSQHPHIRNLFFNTCYNPPLYSEAHFLYLAQAVEVYYREMKTDGTIIPKAEFQELITSISAHVPEKYTWLVEKMKSLNQARLYEMVNRLYQDTQVVMEHFFVDGNTFARKVTDTRNYFTHPSEDKKSKKPVRDELRFLREALKYLLVTLFLLELGFTVSQCEELLEQNNNFIYYSNQKKRFGNSGEAKAESLS